MCFPRFIVLATLLASMLGNAAGQVRTAPVAAAKSQMDTVVQRLGAAFMQPPGRVDLSIGITRNGQTYFYNFGTTEEGKSQVATQHTVYESTLFTK